MKKPLSNAVITQYAIEDENETKEMRQTEIYLKEIAIKEEIGGGHFGNALLD